VTTIVVGAGRGSRLGGPKALLCWAQLPQKWLLPLAAAHVEARAESQRVIVVVREPVETILRRVAAMSFARPGIGELVVSHAPDELGPAGSLAAAAPHVTAEDEVLLVTPVDCPPARSDTVKRLLDGLAAAPNALAAKLRYEGRGGHPVALRPAVLARYRQPSPPPLRDRLREVEVVDVPVDDPMVTLDIDRPEDLAHWSRKYGGGAVDEVAFYE
jgi:molybdenum cofactor cytidylyltransferase